MRHDGSQCLYRTCAEAEFVPEAIEPYLSSHRNRRGGAPFRCEALAAIFAHGNESRDGGWVSPNIKEIESKVDPTSFTAS
jgi:hypothetical protein